MTATGWLPHTTRAALTGLRKKGHVIEREQARRRDLLPHRWRRHDGLVAAELAQLATLSSEPSCASAGAALTGARCRGSAPSCCGWRWPGRCRRSAYGGLSRATQPDARPACRGQTRTHAAHARHAAGARVAAARSMSSPSARTGHPLGRARVALAERGRPRDHRHALVGPGVLRAQEEGGGGMKTVRCAIYTRKSSDEGLEQSFN